MTHFRACALVALVVLGSSCASRSGAPAPRIDRNTISEAEILAAGSSDAYAIVQSLRPQWLQIRGPSTITLTESVKVYLDGSLLGGPDYLRQINALTISSIRYLDALEATQRWGLDHGHGAIVVISRRSDPSP